MPEKDNSRLALQEGGLRVLAGVRGHVTPVFVIGPYRSGKSFTLNQLMGVGCGERARACAWAGVWLVGWWRRCVRVGACVGGEESFTLSLVPPARH